MEKILVAGIHHESNTFNPIKTGINDFSLQRGAELFDVLNTEDSVSGIVRTLSEAGYGVAPALVARAVPNGVVQKNLYLELKEDLIKRALHIIAEDNVVGIALSLHGSMRVEEIGEAEGDLLSTLRESFPDLPFVASLDMHAILTETMVQHLDAFTGYKQAPHTDCFETGVHAAQMLIRILKEKIKPAIAWCKLPLIIAGEKTETSVEPMKMLIDLLREKEKQQGVMAASFLLGFPWADCPENGVSAVVVTDESEDLAGNTAEKLSLAFWQQRENFKFHTVTLGENEALEAAYTAATEGYEPVYVSDSGDNPTAGSSSDCTGFLGKVLDYKPFQTLDKPVMYAGIYDPKAVEFCFEAGENVDIDVAVGAVFDTVTSKPLRIKGTVKSLCSRWGRFSTDMALMCTGRVHLLLVSKHIGFVAPDMFAAMGTDAEDFSVIVVKLGYLTEPHKKIAKKSIMALSSGSSNEVLESLPYKGLNRPLFPFDKSVHYTPAAFIKHIYR